MQEFLAAHHVSTLPINEQLDLLQQTFWDDLFNYMWVMYVGIVGIHSEVNLLVHDHFFNAVNFHDTQSSAYIYFNVTLKQKVQKCWKLLIQFSKVAILNFTICCYFHTA